MLSVSMIALAATMVSCSKDDNGGNGGNNKPKPESWIGTWDIVSSQTLTWTTSGQYPVAELNDTEKEGTITITEYDDTYAGLGYNSQFESAGAPLVFIYGLSDIDYSLPAIGLINEEDNSLWVYNGYQLTDNMAEADNMYACWGTIDTEGYPGSGLYPAFVFDLDSEATAAGEDVEWSDGSVSTVASMLIMLMSNSSNNVSIYTDVESYAGELTLTYVSDDSSLPTNGQTGYATMSSDMKMVYPARVVKVAVAR